MSAGTSLTMPLTSRYGTPPWSTLRCSFSSWVSLVVAMSGSGKWPDSLKDFSLCSIPLPSSAYITSGTCSDSASLTLRPIFRRWPAAITYSVQRIVQEIGEDRVYMKDDKYISFHSPVSHDREGRLSVSDECRQALSSASRLSDSSIRLCSGRCPFLV